MADSQTANDDCLSDPSRMLDALKSLTTQSREASVLRTMFGAGDGVEPAKALVVKAGQSLQELSPNLSSQVPPI